MYIPISLHILILFYLFYQLFLILHFSFSLHLIQNINHCCYYTCYTCYTGSILNPKTCLFRSHWWYCFTTCFQACAVYQHFYKEIQQYLDKWRSIVNGEEQRSAHYKVCKKCLVFVNLNTGKNRPTRRQFWFKD